MTSSSCVLQSESADTFRSTSCCAATKNRTVRCEYFYSPVFRIRLTHGTDCGRAGDIEQTLAEEEENGHYFQLNLFVHVGNCEPRRRILDRPVNNPGDSVTKANGNSEQKQLKLRVPNGSLLKSADFECITPADPQKQQSTS